jgi:DUF1680 family protein
MRPKWIEARPEVEAARGKVALTRGPLVYCSELLLAENGRQQWNEGANVVGQRDFVEEIATINGVPIVRVRAKALTDRGSGQLQAQPARSSSPWGRELYRELPDYRGNLPETGVVDLSFTPYFIWANRGDAYMRIWMPRAGANEATPAVGARTRADGTDRP